MEKSGTAAPRGAAVFAGLRQTEGMGINVGRRLTIIGVIGLLWWGAQQWKVRIHPADPGVSPFQSAPNRDAVAPQRPASFPTLTPFEDVSRRRLETPATPPAPTTDAALPHLKSEMVQLMRLGPVRSQNLWRDEDCEIAIPLRGENSRRAAQMSSRNGAVTRPEIGEDPSNNRWRAAPDGFSAFTPWELRGAAANGRVLLSGIFGSVTPLGDGSLARQALSPPRARAAEMSSFLHATFDLDRVPNPPDVVVLKTQWPGSDGRNQTFRVVVRPFWFTRAARTIALESARWLAPDGGDEGSVEVTLRALGASPLLVDEPQGSQISWQAAPMSGNQAGREMVSERKLLHNWSPQLEGAGGIDSHTAKDAKVWKSYRQFVEQLPRDSQDFIPTPEPIPVERYLTGFWPKIWAQKPARRGELITVRYRFYGMRDLRRPAIFRTDIGVAGDGFLRVSVASPRTPRTPQNLRVKGNR